MDCPELRIGLTAVLWSGGGDWLKAAQKHLEQQGLSTTVRHRKLDAWDSRHRQKIGANPVDHSEGWTLTRVSVGQKDPLIGVSPHRFYFRQGEDRPSNTPWYKLLPNRSAPPRRSDGPQTLLNRTGSIVSRLSTLPETQEIPDLAGHVLGRDTLQRRIGKVCFQKTENLHGQHKKYGYHRNPNRVRIAVVPLAGVSQQFSHRFCEGLNKELLERKVESPRIQIASVNQVITRLDGPPAENGSGACFVFLFKKKGSEGTSDLRLLHLVEENGFSFRRAYEHDPLEHSIPDQVGSILAACGGSTFALDIEIGRTVPWTMGIDLSHDNERRRSRLCVTLVNPKGELKGSWKASQSLNERADPNLLRKFLGATTQKALAEDSAAEFLLFRDGKWPEGVDRSSILKTLGNRATMLDVRKRGNPLLWKQVRQGVAPVPKDSWTKWPGKNTLFLCPDSTVSGQGYGRVLKLWWEDRENLLGLDSDTIAKLTLGTRYAPALGTKTPILPASIYWADGIAGASETDLRFRGQ